MKPLPSSVRLALGLEGPRRLAALELLGGIDGLAVATVGDLVAAGVPERKARAFDAARKLLAPPPLRDLVERPEDLHRWVRAELEYASVEKLVLVLLNAQHRILHVEVATVGSARFTVVDPQGIYRLALLYRAGAVALAHNHPSGDPRPSQQDLEVTRVVEAAGRVIGIPLLDHLVVTRDGYRSIREQLGFMPGSYGPNIVQSR